MRNEEGIFDYQTPFLLNAIIDSEHKSRRLGTGSDFYKKSHFLADPNPARIDLTATLTDPFESIYVKNFRQRSKLNVLTLLDGSDSIAIARQVGVMSQLERSINKSVAVKNDRYERYLISETLVPINQSSEIQQHFVKGLGAIQYDTALAINKLEAILPKTPALIFLVSDFHWSEDRLRETFTTLSGHYVIPIVLWHKKESESHYPLWRFIQIQDAESGQHSLIFVTPKQKQHIAQKNKARKQYLQNIFQRYQRRALWVSEQFKLQDLSSYFHGL
jgi:hypothetical protein